MAIYVYEVHVSAFDLRWTIELYYLEHTSIPTHNIQIAIYNSVPQLSISCQFNIRKLLTIMYIRQFQAYNFPHCKAEVEALLMFLSMASCLSRETNSLCTSVCACI